jgi:type II secretory pathway pseudopilin PulG
MTLLELLIVVAVMAITVAIAIPTLRTTLATYRRKLAATQVAMDIRAAISRAEAGTGSG